ncbi:MAG: FHA domain-containing protein [Planctomycetes bacterium]|nr:FHA domain-containing protein [Planctomycetota bacterium]
MPEMLMIGADGREHRFPVGDSLLIGRGHGVDIFVPDTNASRKHAKLTKRDDGYFVEDLGSRNGTKVNGQKIKEARKVVDGDEVQIGRVRLLFRDAPEGPRAADRIGRFQILGKLGGGGMAEVFKALDTRNNLVVALKVIKASVAANPEFIRRFHDKEAQIARGLNHPNIVEVFEDGVADGLHFIAMEYVEGESLLPRAIRQRVELREALEILKQVARGLDVAHERGIVHRDIKLSNLFFKADAVSGAAPSSTPAASLRLGTVSSEPDKPKAVAQLPTPQFVGRGVELMALDMALQAASQSGGFVLIRSDEGFGKTRLLEEFGRKLSPHEAKVVSVSAAGSPGPTYDPAQKLVEAVFGELTATPHELPLEKARVWAATLWQVAPSLSRGILADLTKPPSREPVPTDAAVQAFCEALALLGRGLPVVLLLDDLQLADERACHFLESLARCPTKGRVLICGAFRDEPGSPSVPFFRALTRLARDGVGTVMFLKPLPRLSMQDLFASVVKSQELGARLVADLLPLTRGSPRTALDLVKALFEKNMLTYDASGRVEFHPEAADQLDAAAAARLTERFGPLGEQAKHVLRAGAVLGHEFTFALVAKVAECREDALYYALNDLAKKGFLTATKKDKVITYAFTSHRFRENLYADMPGRERMKLHECAGLALEEMHGENPDPASETLAYHFTNGQVFDRAVAYLLKAGEKARAEYRVDAAKSGFQSVLRLLEAGARDARLSRAVVKQLKAFYQREADYRRLLGAELDTTRPAFMKIGDFGLAVTVEEGPALINGRIPGTARYMSPEQIRGEALDGKSDVFSLGIAAYEMLAGKQAFRARRPKDFMRANLLKPMPSVRERRPDLPPAVDLVIQRMTAKDKAERYDAAALVRDIERLQLALPFLTEPGFELTEPKDRTSAFFPRKSSRVW